MNVINRAGGALRWASLLLNIVKWLCYSMIGLIAAIFVFFLTQWTSISAHWMAIHPNIEVDGRFGNFHANLLLLFLSAIAGFVVVAMIIRRLQAMTFTVQNGDPFVRINAKRLREIGWLSSGLIVWKLAMTMLVMWIATVVPDISAHFSVPLIEVLAVLLILILAEIFDQGAAMREELEGTI